MKTESENYDIETGETLYLKKTELINNFKLIKREKTYKQIPEFTIVWQNGWRRSRNDRYEQKRLF